MEPTVFRAVAEPTITFAVVTSRATRQRALDAHASWCADDGARCLFYADAAFGEGRPPGLAWAVVRSSAPPAGSCCKQRRGERRGFFCSAHRRRTLAAQYRFLPALRLAQRSSYSLKDRPPWLVLLDDDSFVFVRRLRRLLARYDPSRPLMLGEVRIHASLPLARGLCACARRAHAPLLFVCARAPASTTTTARRGVCVTLYAVQGGPLVRVWWRRRHPEPCSPSTTQFRPVHCTYARPLHAERLATRRVHATRRTAFGGPPRLRQLRNDGAAQLYGSKYRARGPLCDASASQLSLHAEWRRARELAAAHRQQLAHSAPVDCAWPLDARTRRRRRCASGTGQRDCNARVAARGAVAQRAARCELTSETRQPGRVLTEPPRRRPRPLCADWYAVDTIERAAG